jgi:drug/metabolite transporter, DME family
VTVRGATRRDVALVLAAASLFGTVGTARVLGPPASAWSLGAVRLAAAALVLLVLALRTGGGLPPVPAGDGSRQVREAGGLLAVRAGLRLRGTWVAGTGQAGFQVCFLTAVATTGVAVGTLVAIGSAPLWTGLVTRRVTRAWWSATALALAGLTLLVLVGQDLRLAPVGVLSALGAGLSYALYLAGSERVVAAGVRPAPAVAGAFLVAAGLLAPALLLGDVSWLASPGGLVLAGYLALGPTVLAYLLLYAGMGGLSPSTVATLGLAEPVVATALGVLVVGEELRPAGVVGAALVLGALLVLARSAAPRRAGRPRAGGPA